TYLLKKRRQQHFPPYLHLARVAITYKTERTTLQKIQKVHAHLRQYPRLHLSAPTPAFHERTTSGYTWQITLRSSSRRAIITALKSLDPSLNPHITLDPPSLL
ncbi:hypothetical protein IJ096_00340, partial [Candidatus Saccharibacteria bacterium]|nr:hypothetical protein [Candidatus Saccharibacteria bacterium]